MIRLAVADLRESWVAWLGVSLAFVVAGAGLASSALLLATASGPGADVLGDDGTSLLRAYGSTNLVLCALVGLAVVGAATRLVVASRRGAVARLQLAGATPGQVTGMLVAQVAVVALVTGLVGDLVAVAAAPSLVDAICRDRALPPVAADVSGGVLLATTLVCVALFVLGALRQARAASAIPPVEALREAADGSSRPEGPVRTTLRGVRFVLCGAAVAVTFPAFGRAAPDLGEDALGTLMQIAVVILPVAGLAIVAVLPWVCGALVRAWTAVVPLRGPAWHLARHTVIARSERLVRSIVPVMFAVGLLVGVMAVGETFVATAATMGVSDLEGTSTTSLLLFMGPALAVAVAGSVGNLVMMSRQRAVELSLVGVVGATPRQQAIVPVLEGVIVTATATLLGLVMAAASVAFTAYGLGLILPTARLSMPWEVLVGCTGVCLVVVIAATVGPVLATLRRPAPEVIARLVAA